MATTLMPETIKSSLQPLQKSIKRVPGSQYNTEEVREYFAACDGTAGLINTLWALAQEYMACGAEGTKLTFFLKESKDALEDSLAVFSEVRGVATPFTEMEDRLTKLAVSTERVEKLLVDVTRVLKWLDDPQARHFDPSLLTVYKPEDYESLDDIVARLDAGGDV